MNDVQRFSRLFGKCINFSVFARVAQSPILMEYGQPLGCFGCHVINRASTDCKGGVRGVSGVSWQVHIVYIGHSQNGQLAAVKTE